MAEIEALQDGSLAAGTFSSLDSSGSRGNNLERRMSRYFFSTDDRQCCIYNGLGMKCNRRHPMHCSYQPTSGPRPVTPYSTVSQKPVFRLNIFLRIYTAVIFTIIRNLRPSTPDHLPSYSDQAKLTHIYLYDRTLGKDPQLRIHGVLRVLLDGYDGQLNSHSKFRMCDVGFLVSEAHGPYEALIFDGPPCKVISH